MQVNVNVHISSSDIVCNTLKGVGFFLPITAIMKLDQNLQGLTP